MRRVRGPRAAALLRMELGGAPVREVEMEPSGAAQPHLEAAGIADAPRLGHGPTGRWPSSLRRCAAALGPRTRLISASFSRSACFSCLSGPVCALQHLTVAPTRRQAHPQRPCRPPGRSRSRSRHHRACSWARWPPAASIGRTFSVVIFRCDRDRCESVCNGTWGLVVRIPAARGRAGGVNETYYDRYVHQGCLWGRP